MQMRSSEEQMRQWQQLHSLSNVAGQLVPEEKESCNPARGEE